MLIYNSRVGGGCGATAVAVILSSRSSAFSSRISAMRNAIDNMSSPMSPPASDACTADRAGRVDTKFGSAGSPKSKATSYFKLSIYMVQTKETQILEASDKS